MMKELQEFIQAITDEVIALSFIWAAIAFIFMGIAIPEFFAVGIGMVLMYYFKKE